MSNHVTETEWLNGPPRRTVVKVRQLKNERSRLLSLCALFGLYRHQLTRPTFAAAIDLMERFADAQVGDGHWNRAMGLIKDFDWSAESLSTNELHDLRWIADCFLAPADADGHYRMPMLKASTAAANLLRDIFGNPFHPISFSPEWRTSDVVSIAQSMYETRDFSPMAILADALQDAGCDHECILAHCHDANGVHVRGCWVVDLVLGKS